MGCSSDHTIRFRLPAAVQVPGTPYFPAAWKLPAWRDPMPLHCCQVHCWQSHLNNTIWQSSVPCRKAHSALHYTCLPVCSSSRHSDAWYIHHSGLHWKLLRNRRIHRHFPSLQIRHSLRRFRIRRSHWYCHIRCIPVPSPS